MDDFENIKLNKDAWGYVAHHINNKNCIVVGISEILKKKHPELIVEMDTIQKCIAQMTEAINELKEKIDG